jgi:DNA-binding Xre family transcriptional regulator
MARRQVSASKLAADIGVSETWVRRRMRRQYEINMDDLERICAALEISPAYFVQERVAA